MNSPSLISRSMPGTAGTSAPGYQRWAFSKVTVAMLYCSPSPAGTCRTIRSEVTCGHTSGCGGLARTARRAQPPTPLGRPGASAGQRERARHAPGRCRWARLGSSRSRTARSPISSNGSATEVTFGRSQPARSEPSNETTATSSGTREPRLGQGLVDAHRDPVVEADQAARPVTGPQAVVQGVVRRLDGPVAPDHARHACPAAVRRSPIPASRSGPAIARGVGSSPTT